MKLSRFVLLAAVLGVLSISAKELPDGDPRTEAPSANGHRTDTIGTEMMYLVRISENVYIHVSWSEFPGFGRFSSNGLVYLDGGKAFLLDTPTTDSLTRELVAWVRDSLHADIIGFIPNHWHRDCMGGLGYLKSIGVESYANQMTIELAKAHGLPLPEHGFRDSLSLKLNDKPICGYYPGPAHSMDNIVVWLPEENILFAGCMIKDLHATGLGNTADGDLDEWPATLDKVIHRYPGVKIVIPGHGEWGGPGLLSHTRELLEQRGMKK